MAPTPTKHNIQPAISAAVEHSLAQPSLGAGGHISLITAQPEMVFDDVEPIQIPVRIGQQQYILQEAYEDAARQFKNAGMRAARLTDGKVTGVEAIADAESLLLSMCLFRVTTRKQAGGAEEQVYEPVPLKTILGWKHRITNPLFKKCVEISGLTEPDTVDTLRKRITADQDKLRKLMEAEGEQESPLKNSSNDTAAISSSPSN